MLSFLLIWIHNAVKWYIKMWNSTPRISKVLYNQIQRLYCEEAHKFCVHLFRNSFSIISWTKGDDKNLQQRYHIFITNSNEFLISFCLKRIFRQKKETKHGAGFNFNPKKVFVLHLIGEKKSIKRNKIRINRIGTVQGPILFICACVRVSVRLQFWICEPVK